MSRISIPVERLVVKPMALWDVQNLLLTSGDLAAGSYNAMTVGWGSLGWMWRMPFVQVVVRPVRYTYEFIERYPTFTLCAFPQACRPALQLLGTRSGRDGDKIAASGLTPEAAETVAAPAYAQAELVLECRKLYWHDFEPDHFLDERIARVYPRLDYHRVYYGEVLAAWGEPIYAA